MDLFIILPIVICLFGLMVVTTYIAKRLVDLEAKVYKLSKEEK